jgi:hypothetical protein
MKDTRALIESGFRNDFATAGRRRESSTKGVWNVRKSPNIRGVFVLDQQQRGEGYVRVNKKLTGNPYGHRILLTFPRGWV